MCAEHTPPPTHTHTPALATSLIFFLVFVLVCVLLRLFLFVFTFSTAVPEHIWAELQSHSLSVLRQLPPDDERLKEIPPQFYAAFPLDNASKTRGTAGSFGYPSETYKVRVPAGRSARFRFVLLAYRRLWPRRERSSFFAATWRKE